MITLTQQCLGIIGAKTNIARNNVFILIGMNKTIVTKNSEGIAAMCPEACVKNIQAPLKGLEIIPAIDKMMLKLIFFAIILYR